MKILIVNPPHPSIGSRIPDDHLPPLGLLKIAGPLIDDGHCVSLFDAELGPAKISEVVEHITSEAPDLLLIGHSGSTSAHTIAIEIAELAKRQTKNLLTIYGGVFPTYHWRDILMQCPSIDYIVKGEGEESCRQLVNALSQMKTIEDVAGIAFRKDARPIATRPRPMIVDLDAYRVGWELIDFADYSYWGGNEPLSFNFQGVAPIRVITAVKEGFGLGGATMIQKTLLGKLQDCIVTTTLKYSISPMRTRPPPKKCGDDF